MAAIGEFELIERYFAPLAADLPGARGLKDDAAVLALPAGEDLVATCDAMVAGVHFLPDDPPDLVARKLLRVNLSDLAAMGAVPTNYLLALALPAPVDEAWVAGFAAGLAEDQGAFGVVLAGGDTVATPGPPTLALTALGRVAAGQALGRAGAAPGDGVYVTGTIGDAHLGLAVLQGRLDVAEEPAAWLADRYRLPQPRLALGPALVGVASAALDVSDGLVADLGHLCTASGVGAELDFDAIPMSSAAKLALTDSQDMAASLVAGGDDYELVFTAPASAAAAIAELAQETRVAIARIGSITPQPGVRVRDAAGRPLELADGGYRHFRGDARR